MTFQQEIRLSTRSHGHMQDLTEQVSQIVSRSQISTCIAHLFVVGSTAALGAIEFEPGLQRDLPETLDRLIPPSRSYGHEQAWHDGNGHSHLQATLLGPSLTVPVSGGRPVLGGQDRPRAGQPHPRRASAAERFAGAEPRPPPEPAGHTAGGPDRCLAHRAERAVNPGHLLRGIRPHPPPVRHLGVRPAPALESGSLLVQHP